MKKLILSLSLLISTSVFAQDPPSLQFLMAQMGQKVQLMMTGILYDNFELIAVSADYVLDHPKPANDLPLIKQELGAEMANFKRIDGIVHSSAQAIFDAANDHNMNEVARNYGKMMRGRVECHDTFRDRLRIILHR